MAKYLVDTESTKDNVSKALTDGKVEATVKEHGVDVALVELYPENYRTKDQPEFSMTDLMDNLPHIMRGVEEMLTMSEEDDDVAVDDTEDEE